MTVSEQPENTLVSGEASTGAAKSPEALAPSEAPTRTTAQHVPLVEQAAAQSADQQVPTDVVLTGQVPVDDRVIGKPLNAEQAQAIRDRMNQTRDAVLNPEPAPEPEPSPEPEQEPEPESEPERAEQPVDPDAVPQSMGGGSATPRGSAPEGPSTDTPIFDSIGGPQ